MHLTSRDYAVFIPRPTRLVVFYDLAHGPRVPRFDISIDAYSTAVRQFGLLGSVLIPILI